MAETVGNLIVNSLANIGVKRVYGVVGDSLNGITDAIYQHKTIQWIHTRHEEVAAFAAGAEAQITNELAVCAGSCGPGNLHLINGLFDCQRNNVPVLAIAAHIPSNEIGGHYFQATHPEKLFQECSVFCEFVSNAKQIPRLLHIALQTAIAEKGVAVLVISGDTILEKAINRIPLNYISTPQPLIIPNTQELQKIATIINQAEKTTLFCGNGCKHAHDNLLNLAKKLQAPIVHPLRGKEFVEYDNPYDVGMTGLIGFSSGYYAMEACDTLIILGSSFPYRQFYPKHAKIIQIDINGSNLGLRCPLTFGAIGDISPTIEALLPLLNTQKNNEHLKKACAHYQKTRKKLDDLAKIKSSDSVVHPQSLVKLLSDHATADAIFSCDVGTPTIWAARYLKMNGKRHLLGSFNHGSMANALAQSIGAQCSHQNRQVIALCGDGGFSMLMGDLLSLIQLKLPVKVVIFNNGTLGFVSLEMKASGLLDHGTSLENPNFADMAKAIGIHGVRVNKPQQLEEGIKSILNHSGPALLDVATNKMELAMPPKISMEQIKGFGLYITKSILNDRGDEIFELAKSNLWR